MKSYPVTSLEVIGCSEVPAKQPPLPRVLSAIFRNPDSDTVLYPPYLLAGNELINPVTAEMADFEERVALDDITKLDPQPAQFGWSLWLDDSGDIQYSPLSLITRNLAAICEKHVQSARDRIAAKDYPAAREHALIADAAHPQHRDRLVLRAAAEFCMAKRPDDNPDARIELEFTEALASKTWHLDVFRTQYQKEANPTLPDSSKLTDATMTRPSTPRYLAHWPSRELVVT
ncbi:MAG: hypothetical protein DVB22_000168 [Verrucomicrobia bacterium]|nr:MAG: hypothetical protein DVB22_000168 [Verrucomicrobiota bacterium]